MISLSYFKDKGLLTKTGKLTTKASEEDKTLWFVYRAILAHRKIYSYDKCIYKRSDAKVIITCPEHGDFLQLPKDHIRGRGCKHCGGTTRLTLRGFINKAATKHKGKYSYDKVEYTNSLTKVTISCPEHGDFEQTPKNHLKGYGCSKCAKESLSAQFRKPLQDFIVQATRVHKGKYSYDKVEYTNSLTKVTISCPEHGDFEQTPKNHLKGCGCTSCGKTVSSVLYLWRIKGTSVYKIGVSTPERVLDRISQVARSNCVEAEDVYYKDLEEDAKPLEHSLHLELSDKKVILLEGDGRQETFLLKPEAVAQIKIKIELLRMAFQGIIVT